MSILKSNATGVEGEAKQAGVEGVRGFRGYSISMELPEGTGDAIKVIKLRRLRPIHPGRASSHTYEIHLYLGRQVLVGNVSDADRRRGTVTPT